MSKKVWTISNIISLIRILLAIPFGIAIYFDEKLLVGGLIVLMIVSDYADGYLARKLNQISELGKILDPIGDKVAVACAGIAMLLTGILSPWYIGVIFGRDFLILLGGLWARSKIGYIIPSNKTGKVAVNLLALQLILAFYEVPFAQIIGEPIVAVVLLYSFIVYGKEMIEIVSSHPKTDL